MQTASKETAHDKVPHDVPGTCSPYKQRIYGKLDRDIKQLNLWHRKRVDDHRSDSVEDDLESAEECFASNGV